MSTALAITLRDLTEILARLSRGGAGSSQAKGGGSDERSQGIADGDPCMPDRRRRDRLVTGRKLPCVVFGELDSNDYSTSTERGEEHLFTLEIWIDAGGRKQAQIVASRLHALLQDAAIDLGRHHLVSLLHVRTLSRREAKTKLYVAVLRFRAVTEPIAAVTS
ncbi:DUF3168 domain-containing protein [Rhizobium sp. R711]|uniref:DUF3168 domain-containing protein n=1 Tax=unclassified Rhizobium TaxID=2613769 RepID=UPI0026C597CC